MSVDNIWTVETTFVTRKFLVSSRSRGAVPTTRSHTHMRALVLLCVTAGTRAFTAVGTTRLQHNAVRTDLRMDVLSLGAGAVVSAAAAVTGGKLVVEKVVLPSLLNGAEKKNSVAVNQYTLGRRLGQGNYGAVYQAEDAKSRVVIKELALSKDENARKFALAELFMNQKLKLCGQSSSVAQYVGHFSSLGEDEYLSIVFKDEGSLTLMDALKDRNFPRNVGSRVGINSDDEAAVIGRITGQVFGSLAAIHGWSIVHRDVKVLLCCHPPQPTWRSLLLSRVSGSFACWHRAKTSSCPRRTGASSSSTSASRATSPP